MARAAPPAIELPRPLYVALKLRASSSPVVVERREERTAGSLRLRCTLSSSYREHLVGGPGPQLHTEGPTLLEKSVDGVDLSSLDACRAAVLELLSVLATGHAHLNHLIDPDEAGEWFEPVIRSAAPDILSQVAMTRGCAFDVSLSVQQSWSCDELEALLAACEQANTSGCAAPDEICAVCMERLPDAAATFVTLPSCRHMFHRGCVAAWFQKAATCPLCRCDMTSCLLDMEEAFWDNVYEATKRLVGI